LFVFEHVESEQKSNSVVMLNRQIGVDFESEFSHPMGGTILSDIFFAITFLIAVVFF